MSGLPTVLMWLSTPALRSLTSQEQTPSCPAWDDTVCSWRAKRNEAMKRSLMLAYAAAFGVADNCCTSAVVRYLQSPVIYVPHLEHSQMALPLSSFSGV